MEDLDCTDTSNQAACVALEQMVQRDWNGIPDESCTGNLKTSAEEIDSCFLDHATCTCPRGRPLPVAGWLAAFETEPTVAIKEYSCYDSSRTGDE